MYQLNIVERERSTKCHATEETILIYTLLIST